jgi:cephalosporin hydroxylase/nucleoside-diphosphate-sugar epimerase
MKVLVTGATGFIGHYVVQELLKRGHQVIATSAHPEKAKDKVWYSLVTYVAHDFYTATDENLYEKFHQPDKLIHLGWGNLSNFKSEDHLLKELPANEAFLKNLISNGLKDITCIGTCLEYGMQEGCLKEDMESKPTIAYPIAKNTLRIALEEYKKQHSFTLKWVRLFYMYGAGQSEKSILPLLDKAIENGDKVFNMSKGDQLRDYLPVEKVSENIVIFALQDKSEGILNCSSNKPVSVKQLVEEHLKRKHKHIDLNTGFYPYPDYEPFQFWGDNTKLLNIINMNPVEQFKKEREELINSYTNNKELKDAAAQFNIVSNRDRYSYNFSWMGRPIIQYPQDMIAMQELIWDIKPDLIIETGIAHGGSLIYYASIMELIGKGEVLGIDIDIRDHNRKEIEAHPMAKRIKMIQGSAIDPAIVAEVAKHAEGKKTVMVCLDSNHTHDHVLAELQMYANFTTVGSYCVVFDTIVEDMPKGMYDRPWDVGNNPKTAVFEYLKTNNDFVIDKHIDNKLLISVAPDGYLKRVK